jgi:hypothetical protein
MHRREHVDATRSEDARDLRDHAFGVWHEHEGMLMKDDIELAVAKRAQIAHVRPEVVEHRAAALRKTPDRLELPPRNVDESRCRTELREEDRVPTAAAGQRQHTLSLEVDAIERAIRDAIEKPPLPGFRSWRRALRTRVRDTRFREPFPHALVVRAHLIDRDALCHGEIVAA